MIDDAREKAILVGINSGNDRHSTVESLKELETLAETAGATCVGEMVQRRDTPDVAHFLGEGKIEELADAVKALEASMVIFDDELSPSQIRNIENMVDTRVIDRSTLILDIFAQRAQSAEGKIQVEIAQLKYSLPRLTGRGIELSRLGGGIGTRGPGESKLETSRRHIQQRLQNLNSQLDDVVKQRNTQRRQREKTQIPTAALVGYTNAGKSTLINRLCGAEVFVSDMLFATLDTTIRGLKLADKRSALVIDTVGFIRNLPHHLIKAFRATLEETLHADLLIHVIDATSPELESQIKVVEGLLTELHIEDKPRIAAFNKVDVAQNVPRGTSGFDKIVNISARTGEGVAELEEALHQLLPGKRERICAVLPYANTALLAHLHKKYELLRVDHLENGTCVEAYVDAHDYELLRDYVV